MRLSVASCAGLQSVTSVCVQVKAPNRQPLTENDAAINERTPLALIASLKKPAVAGCVRASFAST
jgi:hypothetical protein